MGRLHRRTADTVGPESVDDDQHDTLRLRGRGRRLARHNDSNQPDPCRAPATLAEGPGSNVTRLLEHEPSCPHAGPRRPPNREQGLTDGLTQGRQPAEGPTGRGWRTRTFAGARSRPGAGSVRLMDETQRLQGNQERRPGSSRAGAGRAPSSEQPGHPSPPGRRHRGRDKLTTKPSGSRGRSAPPRHRAATADAKSAAGPARTSSAWDRPPLTSDAKRPLRCAEAPHPARQRRERSFCFAFLMCLLAWFCALVSFFASFLPIFPSFESAFDRAPSIARC